MSTYNDKNNPHQSDEDKRALSKKIQSIIDDTLKQLSENKLDHGLAISALKEAARLADIAEIQDSRDSAVKNIVDILWIKASSESNCGNTIGAIGTNKEQMALLLGTNLPNKQETIKSIQDHALGVILPILISAYQHHDRKIFDAYLCEAFDLISLGKSAYPQDSEGWKQETKIFNQILGKYGIGGDELANILSTRSREKGIQKEKNNDGSMFQVSIARKAEKYSSNTEFGENEALAFKKKKEFIKAYTSYRALGQVYENNKDHEKARAAHENAGIHAANQMHAMELEGKIRIALFWAGAAMECFKKSGNMHETERFTIRVQMFNEELRS